MIKGFQHRGKRLILKNSMQSGVPGVSWLNSHGAWQVSWYEAKKAKKTYFVVRQFMGVSKMFDEAEADALRAAIEFRKDLERSGIVKAKRVEKDHSGAKGVFWHTRDKAWEVTMNFHGKTLYGGTFTPKDSTPEEVERARLLAVDSRRKFQLRGTKK